MNPLRFEPILRHRTSKPPSSIGEQQLERAHISAAKHPAFEVFLGILARGGRGSRLWAHERRHRAAVVVRDIYDDGDPSRRGDRRDAILISGVLERAARHLILRYGVSPAQMTIRSLWEKRTDIIKKDC